MSFVDWLQTAAILALGATLYVQMRTIGILMGQIDQLEEHVWNVSKEIARLRHE